MSKVEMTQRLFAILAADAAGYSRLMAGDQGATIATLEEYRLVFRGAIEARQGRVVDMAGDSVLAVFETATGAMQAALDVQAQLAERNGRLPEPRRMHFRIGVNLGEIVWKSDGSVYGDGVNVAARLEELADVGGICISGTVYDHVEGKLPVAFKSIGEQAVKNIPKPVRAYRLVSATARQAPYPKRAARRIWATVLVAVCIAGIAWWQAGYKVPGPEHRPRLAILPLDSISPSTDDEYLADGMTEELISRLSRLEGLDVIARTTVMQYKGSTKSISAVGQELNVGTVMEGSVRRSGNKIRLTVQLIDAQTQAHLWSQDYDRDLKDVLAAQGDISEQVARVLHVKLLGPGIAATVPSPVDPEAYTLYLKGLVQSATFTPEGLQRSVSSFRQALKQSPEDARAWSGLAKAYLMLGWWAYEPPGKVFPQAKAAAEKAIALDGNLGRAHSTLGMVRFLHDWDWLAAEQSLLKGLELGPGDADAHLFHGIWLKAMGRNNEAVAEIARANQLDPLYLMASAETGWVEYYGNRLDTAVQGCRRTLELDPHYLFAMSCLQMALAMKKDPEAIALGKKMVGLTGGDLYFKGQLGWAQAALGQSEDALDVLTDLESAAQKSPVPTGAFLYVHLGLGNRDATLAAMEKAYQERSADLVWINTAPEFHWLRDDPRFQALLKRMAFPG